MIATTDLHIHLSNKTRKEQIADIKTLSRNAAAKGINLIGFGDCLLDTWRKELTFCEKIDEGTFEFQNIRFILNAEIETNDNVHHLLYFPSLSAVDEFKKKITPYSSDINHTGKPHVNLNSEELAAEACDVDALIGPAHIFNPWTGLYGFYNSLEDCYGEFTTQVHFVELGLSAHADYADRIQELHQMTFLTNSDAHNPHPVRLGREFTRFKVTDLTYEEIKKGLLRTGGNRPILNVGLPPEEGKYNESACISCQRSYPSRKAKKMNWKCVCGNPIKKGVKDRIEEKATFPEPRHPLHRPLYLSLLPLAEIITKALDQPNPFTENVAKRWRELVTIFGNEICVLLDTHIDDIAKVTVPAITEAIQAFREANVFFKPGGGGRYGKIIVPQEEKSLVVSLKPEEKYVIRHN